MVTTQRFVSRTAAIFVTIAALAVVGASTRTANVGAARPRQPAVPIGTLSLADLERAFRTPPDDARIMMRWWWFGPTVTKDRLDREMRLMKEGGIGGFEIQPVYPVVLDDPASGLVTHPFLSDAFIDDLRFAASRARELGLRVDLTIGSGWPYGGPQIGITQAAGKLRIEHVPVPAGSDRIAVPDIRSGERLLAAFLAPSAAPASADGFQEISEITDGVLRLPNHAAHAREAVFFVSSRTGMLVKRPAVGAEGFVLDHYDRAALDHYLRSVGDRLLSAFDAAPPYAVFCDSLEVYDSDWTDRFLAEFQARRGYDLRPLLPALLLDSGPATPAIRHDWGQTLTELLNERFLAPMQVWAHQHNTRFRVQGYGVPPATISSNAGIDLPEGEGSQWKTLRASRWAASIGHLYDRPVISSETWTWLHSPVFRATPLDLKAEADLHFLQGINQLIGHGWPYTADGVASPGWRFYAAGAFNDRNPWWIVMPDLARYLQRLSFLLRQGKPVNDVAVYLPNDDAWAHVVPGKIGSMIDALAQRIGPDIVTTILDAGFNLDFVDDGVLAERARVDQGRLAVGQSRYRAVILPGVERIPMGTLRALETFAQQGVIVMATRRTPALAPGYQATVTDHAAVGAAAGRLFRGPSATGVFVEREADLAAALTSRVPPDMAVSVGAADIGAVHRRFDAADIYFVANTSNLRRSFEATFRLAASRAQLWNPLTGDVTPIAVRRPAGREGATVRLDLAPYESTVVVFATGGPPPKSVEGPRVAATPPPMDITSGWRVRFGPTGTVVDWDTLRSWTDDEATRYFSGVAVYEKQVDLPASMLRDGQSVVLDFGEPRPIEVGGPRARVQAWVDAPVRDAAVVTINGRRAGSVWCPPYSLDVTPLLRPGSNVIRIEVANLAINDMASRALPDYRLLNLRYGTRFEPQDMDKVQPVPAGLFGPIRLVVTQAARPATLTR
ncbi:MAG: glycosyl hydrolase [Acidobacteria bacterium]|nr:glycosyl hydrolase [Acidobacteriota bacterium]